MRPMQTIEESYCRRSACRFEGPCGAVKHAAFSVFGSTGTRPSPAPPFPAGPPDTAGEADPARLAARIGSAGLSVVSLLACIRDDWMDGGTARLGALVRAIRGAAPGTTIELHAGDLRAAFHGWRAALGAAPHLVHQWLLAAPRLYKGAFEGTDPVQSLECLRIAKEEFDSIRTRATLVLGFGETKDELVAALADLKSVRTDEVLLAPRSPSKHPVALEMLEKVLTVGRKLGFARLECVEAPIPCAPARAEGGAHAGGSATP